MRKNKFKKTLIKNYFIPKNNHISFHKTKPLINDYFNTSTNFNTNSYEKDFQNFTFNNNNNNNDLNILSQSYDNIEINKINQTKKIPKQQINKYINYLKNNLNSSHYANNELNNEYSKLLLQMRIINESIRRNTELYNLMSKSYIANLEKNKKNKDTYIDIIDQYQIYNVTREDKNNNLNKIINSQENDIIKLLNENNKLTDDIDSKKYFLNYLQNLIEYEKYKNIYEQLNENKNDLTMKNKNIKLLKDMNQKAEELKLSKDKLKIDLSEKDIEFSEKTKIKTELLNKINIFLNKSKNINNLINDKNNSQGNENENKIDLGSYIKKIKFNNNTQYYQKLIEEENNKNDEINKQLKMKTNELNKVKNDIKILEIKNKKERNSINELINELNSNNEKIQNNIEQKKKNALKQRSILLKYNKEFKDSLNYKKNLIVKIEEIKEENKKLKDRKNRKNKNLILKTKKNKNENYSKDKNKILKYNFTEPNNLMTYKSSSFNKKSFSYDNIFYFPYQFTNYNSIKNNYEKGVSAHKRKGKYIYTIDKQGKLLSYGIDIKKFVYINTSFIQGWKSFYSIYKKNSEGSLLLNTLGGLFILTGDNYNKLFYYSQSKNMIFLIKSFETNHKFGGMLFSKDCSKIIILGGEYTNSVILFDIQKNQVINLPKLIYKRINSSYNIINDRYILSFFGKGNNTIEYLDLFNNTNKNTWKVLNYKNNNYEIKELIGHISFNINNNIIMIIGGKNNDKVIIFFLKEKYLDTIKLKIKINEKGNIKEFIFDKEKCFNYIEENNNEEIIGMDNEGNVHCFNNDDFAYNIFVFN